MTDKCEQKVGKCIKGDVIFIECRKPGKWEVFHKSNSNKGSCCTVKKNVTATIVKGFTNIEK